MMSTPNNSIAVVASEQQALAQPVTPSQTSAVAEPISAAQAEIAFTPDQIDKLPVPQFKQQYNLRVAELATVKAERDELAIQLTELKPAADKLEALGGLPFIEQAVAVSNLYLDIAKVPLDANGKITKKHFDAGQKFVDTIYEISPPSGDAMEQVMHQLYGGRAWDQYAVFVFGKANPTDAEVEAVKAFVDGGYQTQAIAASPQSDALPAYCYTTDDYGAKVEIPEYAAIERRKEARIKNLETQLKVATDQQNAKTAAQKASEEQAKQQADADRQTNYRKEAFKPVEETILKMIPDAATNPKAQKLRRLLEIAAEDAGGENLKLGLEHAKLSQMGKANGLLSGIQAKIRLAVAEEATDWLQRQGAPTLAQQLEKVKHADSAIATGAQPDSIPYRPERGDYPMTVDGEKKFNYDRAVHRATYRPRYGDEAAYLKATIKSAIAAA